MGVVVFQALDYGLDEAEEHKLSSGLERLIERATSEGEEGDEGIDVDDDSKTHRQLYFDDVITVR